jgi:hypothetical protein
MHTKPMTLTATLRKVDAFRLLAFNPNMQPTVVQAQSTGHNMRSACPAACKTAATTVCCRLWALRCWLLTIIVCCQALPCLLPTHLAMRAQLQQLQPHRRPAVLQATCKADSR